MSRQSRQFMTERPKVLIVDDEALMGLLYQKHIENAGYSFANAKSAEEGLALVAKEKPAIIVLDVLLPSTDGLAALRALKGRPETKVGTSYVGCGNGVC